MAQNEDILRFFSKLTKKGRNAFYLFNPIHQISMLTLLGGWVVLIFVLETSKFCSAHANFEIVNLIIMWAYET